MKKLTYLLLLTFFCIGAQYASAQKFGYLNSSLLLSEHPDVKVADSELETLQSQYAARINKKVEDLKAKYAELSKKDQEGTIPPKELQEQVRKLQEQEVALQGEEQQLQKDLVTKREQLYQPIIDRINEAIKNVATEGDYTYIFDQSQGSILYADESQDVSKKIKAKLGM
jgi:outer membrane protein